MDTLGKKLLLIFLLGVLTYGFGKLSSYVKSELEKLEG